MNNQQALNILNQASADYKGTRTDHVQIQKAIEQLQTLINEDAQRKLDEKKDPDPQP